METEPIYKFTATGEAFRDKVSVPVTIAGSYDSLGSDPVQCTVVPIAGKAPPEFSGVFSDQETLQLSGKTEHGKEIWIPRFRVASTTQAGFPLSWKGIAEFCVEGDLDEFDASRGEIVCSASVPPTPLALSDAMYVPSYDGTITIERGEREGICWNTTLGEAELIDNYHYQRRKGGLNPFLIRIQRCQVTIRIRSPGLVSLKTMSRDLQEALDEPLWLLSFLSRKRVSWYEAEITFYPRGDETGNFRVAKVRQEQWLGYEQESREISWLDLLVKRQPLKDGLFQQLLTNYEESPFKSIIHRVIPYLLVSHGMGYIETRIGLLYSALEGLVNVLGADSEATYLLGSARFKRLSKKLKEFIRGEINEQNVVEGIIRKLPELRRRAFLDRLLTLIKKHDLDVTKLWPLGIDMPSELGALIKRRNIYVHQGRIDDHGLIILDLHRIQNLVELWILKLLDCPETALNLFALNRGARIN